MTTLRKASYGFIGSFLISHSSLWANQAQPDKDPQVLAPGRRIERALAPGQTHTYQITAVAGQYLHAVIEQDGLDVAGWLLLPDGSFYSSGGMELIPPRK